jgi:hypothetical protein
MVLYREISRKQKRQQHRQPQNKRGAPEDLTVPVPLVTPPVVLLVIPTRS